jgi:hypothetical protein
MDDPFNPERKIVRLKKQNLFGSGYAGLGNKPSFCLPRHGSGFSVTDQARYAARTIGDG